jgi:HNH endonuclease
MGSRAPQRQSRWVRVDRRYNQPFRLTGYAWWMVLKWGGLLIIWAALVSSGSPFLDVIATAALIAYAVVRVRRYQRVSQFPQQGRAVMGMSAVPATAPAPPPLGERNSRTIPQDVKIAVAHRDGAKCRQCGSTQDLHFDHVIPWSRGGANTASNIQLLCGPCNRRKGADDIPV